MLQIGQKVRYPDQECANDYMFEGRITKIEPSERGDYSFYTIPVYHQDSTIGSDELLIASNDSLIELVEEDMEMPFIEVAPKRLVGTKEMPKDEWLAWRRNGVTGTDTSAIFGMNQYKTEYQCYQDKLGLLPEVEDNNRMRFGRDFEDVVAKWFTEETGFKTENRFAIYQHGKYEWMLANIDRWIVGQKAVLECKTANYMFQKDLWGESGTDQVPESYLFQIYFYMIVFGVRTGYLAVIFTDTKEFRHYKFDLDEELAQAIIQRTYAFWYNNVQAGIEPEITTMEDLVSKYPNSNKEAIVADKTTKALCLEHEQLRQEIKSLEKRQEVIQVEVGKVIGEHKQLLVNDEGKALAGFSTPKPRSFVNIKKLRADWPKAANDAIYENDPKRSLSMKWQTLSKELKNASNS